jgi:hypothetical protein
MVIKKLLICIASISICYACKPREYRNVATYGNQYYWNHQKCMSVIYQRDPYSSGAIPVVSFLYGLSEIEEQCYANEMGNKKYFD